MVGSSARWLATLRPLQRQPSISQRGFTNNTILLAEDSASSPSITSPPRTLNVVAALRQNIAKGEGREGGRGRGNARGGRGRPQQDRSDRQYGADRPPRQNNGMRMGQRPDRDNRREGGQRFERRDGQERRGGGRGGMRGGRGGRGGNRGGARGGFSRGRQAFEEEDAVSLTPTPVQSVYPVTNWHHGATGISVGYNRVPYATPAITLENLKAEKSTKITHPHREADSAIRLHFTSNGSVMGPLNNPTPIVRPRDRNDDAPTRIRSDQDGSIAQETKKARVKYMQEKFGGDYQRWEKKELISKALSNRERPGVVQGHAAEALIRNEDLGPSHKAWTLGAIDTILTGRKAS
jgi:hypothetical protein